MFIRGKISVMGQTDISEIILKSQQERSHHLVVTDWRPHRIGGITQITHSEVNISGTTSWSHTNNDKVAIRSE